MYTRVRVYIKTHTHKWQKEIFLCMTWKTFPTVGKAFTECSKAFRDCRMHFILWLICRQSIKRMQNAFYSRQSIQGLQNAFYSLNALPTGFLFSVSLFLTMHSPALSLSRSNTHTHTDSRWGLHERRCQDYVHRWEKHRDCWGKVHQVCKRLLCKRLLQEIVVVHILRTYI